MECRDVRDVADTFLAQESTADANEEILGHLDTCQACRDDLEARHQWRRRVGRAFRNASDLDPMPGFTVRLVAALREAAEQPAPFAAASGPLDGSPWPQPCWSRQRSA